MTNAATEPIVALRRCSGADTMLIVFTTNKQSVYSCSTSFIRGNYGVGSRQESQRDAKQRQELHELEEEQGRKVADKEDAA